MIFWEIVFVLSIIFIIINGGIFFTFIIDKKMRRYLDVIVLNFLAFLFQVLNLINSCKHIF